MTGVKPELGICKYCGKPTGIFRTKHSECEQLFQDKMQMFESIRQNIILQIAQFIQGQDDLSILESKLQDLESSNPFLVPERYVLLTKGWGKAVDLLIDGDVISDEHGDRLGNFKSHFSIKQADLDPKVVTRCLMASVLNNVNQGIIQEIHTDSTLPIQLGKNEKLVWAFKATKYYEDKIRREFVGGSRGMSFHVTKGVTFRTGAFRGHSIETTERSYIDTGVLFLTSKNLFFYGPQKSLKIPYAKVISFDLFSEGIGLMQDSATAKHQFFLNVDGNYLYNLITKLACLSNS